MDSIAERRRRTRATVALIGMAAAAVVGLMNGLSSCSPRTGKPDAGRPVSHAEALRLASVRVRDAQDGHSGFRATIGTPGAAVHLTGWIDWGRPLLYLTSVGDKPGPWDGLVEAVPDLVAARLGRSGSADDGYPPPPATPPADGWRVRGMTAESPFDSLFSLLFSLRAAAPDDATALSATGTRFLRRDLLRGVPVDVISGPAVLPSAARRPAAAPSPTRSPLVAAGGELTYWLDDGSRLRRLDAMLRRNLPVRVDFTRDDPTVPMAIAPLGGAAVAPRPVTPAEAALLARMISRQRSVRGGRITVALPEPPAGLLRADGWVDWRGPDAYLAARNPDNAAQDLLVWADRSGVRTRRPDGTPPAGAPAAGPPADGTPPAAGGPRAAGAIGPPAPDPGGHGAWKGGGSPAPRSALGSGGAAAAGPPPVRPPAGGWHAAAWTQPDPSGLTLLLAAVLAPPAEPAALRSRAFWLREDALAGVPVTVYEIHGPDESGTAPGQGRLRYWVDRSGLLLRVEVRTADQGYGWLDVSVGAVPALTPPR